MKDIYHFKVKKSDGSLLELEAFRGQCMLIVNTASKCGFSPQFGSLQQLYEQYKEQGFVILGFPSDQFANQEYEDIEETLNYCQLNYGVTFPMMAKIHVNGKKADPLFQYLKTQQQGFLSSAIKWNFTKFLIDREGRVVKRYAPTVEPHRIEDDVRKLLGESP